MKKFPTNLNDQFFREFYVERYRFEGRKQIKIRQPTKTRVFYLFIDLSGTRKRNSNW